MLPVERRSCSNVLCFSAARKGSWPSESRARIRSLERLSTEALRSFGILDQQHYVVSSAGLKIVTTRGLCRTFVHPQNQKGYSLELPSPPFKAKMGCNRASYCSQGAGSYPLTYALDLTHLEFQDPTQFYLIYLFKRHDQAEGDGA